MIPFQEQFDFFDSIFCDMALLVCYLLRKQGIGFDAVALDEAQVLLYTATTFSGPTGSPGVSALERAVGLVSMHNERIVVAGTGLGLESAAQMVGSRLAKNLKPETSPILRRDPRADEKSKKRIDVGMTHMVPLHESATDGMALCIV
jgi:hypothetical protein